MKHIVLLFGEDQFGLHEKLNLWKEAFIAKYGGDINLEELTGNTPPNEIIEATEALPFLGDKRLVIVKNFFSEQNSDNLKKMVELLKEIPESCALIFYEITPPDRRTALFKALQKSARLEECKPLSGSLLIDWIVEKAKEYGSSISPGDAGYLNSLSNGDTWRLQNEIQKLALYAAPNVITREMIDELVSGHLQTSIFKLTDSLGQKNTKEAIQIFHELVERGEAIPMIFSMLTRQIRLILQTLDTQKTTTNPGQIASKLKQHPYAVSSTLSQCKNFHEDELKHIYNQLIQIDRNLKTGEFRYSTTDQREYLLRIEKFIVETCETA